MVLHVRSLDEAKVAGRRVLVRADLNVPLEEGRVTDPTRIERLVPTLRELAAKSARVIILSHLGRPKGKRDAKFSLAPLQSALKAALSLPVRFCADCIGENATASADALKNGELLLLENLRFYPGEEANDAGFAKALAALGELFVNDAFSVSHRAHASVVGLPRLLPAYAGRLMMAELTALDSLLTDPVHPMSAIVGGAKVSTKIGLLGSLFRKAQLVMIGGAMANTFLAAQGLKLGRSLEEAERHEEALRLLEEAKVAGCRVLLPVDAVVAPELRSDARPKVVGIDAVPADAKVLDIGPASVAALTAELPRLKTLVWNGPVGAFEAAPFAKGTLAIAKAVAEATEAHGLRSVAGGGDTVAALNHAGVAQDFSFVSTAGGAFLEWMEGRALPGVAALETAGVTHESV